MDSDGFSLAEIAGQVGAELEGDGSIRVTSAAPLASAGQNDISFLANPKYAKYLTQTRASALVLDTESERPPQCPVALRHTNPYLIFSRVVKLLYAGKRQVDPGVSPVASIHPDASVAATAGIGPFCVVSEGASLGDNVQLVSGVHIGRNVVVGDNCLIHPGVSILDNCRLGNNVIVHAGTVIGSDGFGFADSEGGHEKVLQIGTVEIADDVEIGANCTIDRGSIGPTKIGRGTKIDNLVQIAHNVDVGEHCIIVAQVGISGSTKLGNRVILAGQVGVVGHIELGDGVKVAAQSGVSRSVEAGKMVFGSPARDYMETQRIEVALRKLPETLKTVKKLQKKFLESDS